MAPPLHLLGHPHNICFPPLPAHNNHLTVSHLRYKQRTRRASRAEVKQERPNNRAGPAAASSHKRRTASSSDGRARKRTKRSGSTQHAGGKLGAGGSAAFKPRELQRLTSNFGGNSPFAAAVQGRLRKAAGGEAAHEGESDEEDDRATGKRLYVGMATSDIAALQWSPRPLSLILALNPKF